MFTGRQRLCATWIHRILVGLLISCAWPSVFAEEPSAEAKLTQQLQAAIKESNPNYQNGAKFFFKDGRLVAVHLMRCKGVTDLSPLRKFDLSALELVNLYNATGVSDLAPLFGCRLKQLNLERCSKIKDLTPLKEMPLTWLRMYACSGVSDLSPLQGMPLGHLDIGLNPRIADLTPLKGMPLHDFRMDNCPQLTDISTLKGMSLEFLSLFGCPKIEDYSVLGTLKLKTLYFDPRLLSAQEIALVRRIPTLEKMGTSWSDYRKEATPAQFWARYDAGEFNSGR